MSLRLKLCLIFGGLLLLTAGGQYWLARSLLQSAERHTRDVAFTVGESVLTLVSGEPAPVAPVAPLPATPLIPAELAEAHIALGYVDPDAPPPELQGAHFDGPELLLRVELDEEGPPRPPPHALRELLIHPAPTAPAATMRWRAVTLRRPEAVEEVEFEVRRQIIERSRAAAPVSGGQAFRIPLPRERIEADRRILQQWLLGSLLILLLGLGAAVMIAVRLSEPLRELTEGAQSLGEGRLGTQIAEPDDPDLRATVKAFNSMSRDLERLTREAEALKESQHITEIGAVTRGLAHSLRNPLNILGLCLEELTELAGDEGRDIAGSARAQIGRMDRALRGLLALSSAQRAAPVSIADLIGDVALELAQGGPSASEVILPEGAPDETLRAVEGELRAALHALLVNAAEASPPGAPVEVRWAREADGALAVSIADRGAGVAAELADTLFSPGVTTKEHGTGMGLFLARRIVEGRYQGALALAPREGGGTLVTLRLRDRREESGRG